MDSALLMSPPAHVIDIVDELKRCLHLAPHLAHFVVVKPYDLGLHWESQYCALELKHIDDAFSFRPKDLLELPHQWDGLANAFNSRGRSGMLVQFCFGLTPKQKKRLGWDGWLLDLTFFISTAILGDKGLDYLFTLEELMSEHLRIDKADGIYNLEPLWTNPYASNTKHQTILLYDQMNST